MQMTKKIYKDIKRLTKLDNKPVANHVSKMFEECGEFCQAVNMTIGMKATDKNIYQIKQDITEEAVDVIQNVLCICSKFDIELDDILNYMPMKNAKWESRINKNKLKNNE
jgi:NTP pyrophosphatase (non-canonical NTP hydrolase)